MSDSDQTFPSLTPTEAALLMTRIEEGARRGAETAIRAYLQVNCVAHEKRTTAMEVVVFGRSEEGKCGLDERVHTLERMVAEWNDDRRWLKRAVLSALILAVTGLLFALANF